jgi:hypothetical protein
MHTMAYLGEARCKVDPAIRRIFQLLEVLGWNHQSLSRRRWDVVKSPLGLILPSASKHLVNLMLLFTYLLISFEHHVRTAVGERLPGPLKSSFATIQTRYVDPRDDSSALASGKERGQDPDKRNQETRIETRGGHLLHPEHAGGKSFWQIKQHGVCDAKHWKII